MRFLVPFLFLFPLHTLASVSINEIMYDFPSPGADSGREWVEIVNAGTEPIDLTEWKFFEGNSNHGLILISGEAVLSPGGTAIIADNAEKFLADNPSFSGQLFDSSFSLNNTGETLTVRNSELADIDSVTYSEEWGGKGDGNSLQKINGTWTASMPTPGAPNELSQKQSNSLIENSSAALPSEETMSFVLSASIVSGTKTTAGEGITFTGKAQKNEDLITARQYVWTFGDGEGGEGKTISHTYASPGVYAVTLNVFYEDQSASDSVSITVLKKPEEEVAPSKQILPVTTVSQTAQGEQKDQKKEALSKENPSHAKSLQPYVSSEKSASITPESIMPHTEQIAALAATERPIFPWLIGLFAVISVPVAFVFFAKPKKSEADEIEIIE